MTDNKTDSNTDNDFGLNHFDQAGEIESQKADTLIETESFYADDLFAETESAEQSAAEQADPFDATLGTDPFSEPGYEKKEPSIPQKAETVSEADMPAPEPAAEQQQRSPDSKTEQPVTAAPITDNPLSKPPAEQRSGTKSITIFAILAMLVAAIAVWLNPGASTSSDSDKSTALNPLPVLAADVQIQRLEARISSLEERSSQQNDALNQQVERLQQQLSALTSQLTKQAKKQQPTRPAAAKRSAPPAHRPSTAALSSIQNTGWVVNLASVDSKYAAIKAQSRYKARGIMTEIHAAVIRGKTWYRLRIGGFASKKEAIAQKHYLAKKHGIKDAWVQKP